MTEVLAVTDPSTRRQTVIDVASDLAELVHAQVRPVPLTGTGDAARAESLLRELDRRDSLLAVLPGGRPLESPWWDIVVGAHKPLVILPDEALPQRRINRVLVPLDGTAEAANTVARTVGLFTDDRTELVVLHVFDEATTPRFWDQAAHARVAWEEEFRARYCTVPDSRLLLRNGRPGDHVVDVAVTEEADLIALGWSQTLEPGRARVVRTTLRRSPVGVLLVPGARALRTSDPGRTGATRNLLEP